MLQQLDQGKINALALADYIEKLHPDSFSMLDARRCVHGHCHTLFGRQTPCLYGRDETLETVLDISTDDAYEIYSRVAATQTQAVAMLRHYAVTGLVSW